MSKTLEIQKKIWEREAWIYRIRDGKSFNELLDEANDPRKWKKGD